MISQEIPIACEAWVTGQAATRLRREYQALWALYAAQPEPIRFFLVSQAQPLAEALIQRPNQICFYLPSWIVCEPGSADLRPLPGRARKQKVGGLVEIFFTRDLREQVQKRLSGLEQDLNQAVSTGAKLLRFATAIHMTHGMLPPAGLVANDIGAKEVDPVLSMNGELAPGYILAEGRPVPVQPFIRIFQEVIALAPYIVMDRQYLQKRSLLLGHWIEQSRELARYQTTEIIGSLHKMERSLTLHRGLRISLPYFDDQELETKLYEITVVPACRIGFETVFVAAAARSEREKIAQDGRFSPTTRNHLLALLRLLEASFRPGSPAIPV